MDIVWLCNKCNKWFHDFELEFDPPKSSYDDPGASCPQCKENDLEDVLSGEILERLRTCQTNDNSA